MDIIDNICSEVHKLCQSHKDFKKYDYRTIYKIIRSFNHTIEDDVSYVARIPPCELDERQEFGIYLYLLDERYLSFLCFHAQRISIYTFNRSDIKRTKKEINIYEHEMTAIGEEAKITILINDGTTLMIPSIKRCIPHHHGFFYL